MPETKTAAPGASTGLRVGTVLGAPILLAWSWFIAAAVITLVFAPWISHVRPDLGIWAWLVAFVFAVMLFTSVLLHELAHGVAGQLCGYRVAAIELNVWGGFTRFEPQKEPDSPASAWRSFLISVVGPLVNLALAGIGWGLLSSVQGGSVAWLLLLGVTFSNLILGAINLLPGIPLDGGWALQALFWRFTGSRFLGTLIASWAGRVIAVGFVVYALTPLLRGEPVDWLTLAWTFAIAVMLWTSASDTAHQAKQARRVETYDISQVIQPAIAASADAPLATALGFLTDDGQRPLVVVLDERGLPSGLLDRRAGDAVDPAAAESLQVADFAHPLGPWIGAPRDITAPHLLESLTHRPKAAFCLVMDGTALTGIIDLQEFFAELLDH